MGQQDNHGRWLERSHGIRLKDNFQRSSDLDEDKRGTSGKGWQGH